ncbi:hypothetical protein LOZ80_01385 [Paenibacillus sp. HWE-109]|uniref:hypothetical protein n=1 Tax=Paenibacillus sp. HWE-109 TaxID=1306526 RepID=UPI001EE15207|nr:hypothetical protein [Paenibacillus sp. HWE-109]UKS27630.1 hypothetical protein LOZ80_01385 [Paenibacillus sp. HWE-109]
MTTFLDARTSQNASFNNSIAIPILAINTPVLVGQVGLETGLATSLMRVQFNGITTIQLPLLPVATTITISIVRGTLPTDPTVFGVSESLNLALLGPQSIVFSGSDYNVPLTSFLIYTMFVSCSVLGTIRVGPESFNATAYF